MMATNLTYVACVKTPFTTVETLVPRVNKLNVLASWFVDYIVQLSCELGGASLTATQRT